MASCRRVGWSERQVERWQRRKRQENRSELSTSTLFLDFRYIPLVSFCIGRPHLTSLQRLDGDGSFTSQPMWSGQKISTYQILHQMSDLNLTKVLLHVVRSKNIQHINSHSKSNPLQCGGSLGQAMGVEYCTLLVQLPISPTWYVII